MAAVDLELASWALDLAKKKGASAAEVLCVSAESLSPECGWRSREAQELARTAARAARILRAIFRDLIDG